MAKIESIAFSNLKRMLKMNPSEHKKTREMYGKFFVGCNLAKY
jgi:hypothetical protein